MTTTAKFKNYRLLIILAVLVVAMFGFGFALVPLYTVMCKSWGINGKTDGTATALSGTVDKTRTITVEFLSNASTGLPWDFYPEVKKITLHPGENKLINYYARNNSNNTMTVQAIPSISPGPAAKYLKKTECFCFTQQTFKAHEGRDMPVLFHIDADLPKHIHVIALSYTMFDTAQLLKPSSNKTPGKIQ
jgi:cytochrome c oxidase assembly protein subunit 11